MTERFQSAPPSGASHRSDPPLTLRDLVEAVCSGIAPSQGIEMMLDRLEGQK